MQLFAALGMGAFILVSLVVSIRLIGLWRETRNAPELLIAMGLLCLGPIAFPLTAAGLRIQQTRPEIGAPLLGLGVAVLAVGGAAAAFFTLVVFRPHSVVAKIAVAAIVVGLAACWTTSALRTGFDLRGQGMDVSGYVSFLLRGSALAWAAFESIRYWRMLRRRVRFGLAEPLTTNRFALWGMGMGAGAMSSLIVVTSMNRSGEVVLTAPLTIALSAVGITAATSLFLAFLPPARYRQFIEESAQREATA